ncbi:MULTISPECIES: prepilin peptidase [unclassified Candidatus Paralachnospira]|uniref:prepilin peptidase n=1 Tax=unclassified Candidatus Paralachnospira TaxID=3099471 RepID=UPI003F8DD366
MNEVKIGITLGYLAVCSWFDLKERKLPVWLLMMGVAAGAAVQSLSVAAGEFRGIEIFLAVLPGGLLLVLSRLAPKQIGSGDGWMVLGTGSVTGAEIYLYLEASFLLMMIPAFWLAVIKKQRNRELPLAPFLLGGTVLVQAMRWSVWG